MFVGRRPRQADSAFVLLAASNSISVLYFLDGKMESVGYRDKMRTSASNRRQLSRQLDHAVILSNTVGDLTSV